MENLDQRIEETVVDNTDYIAAIKELKQNSVSKEDYLKLKQENRNLLSSLVNGETINNPDAEKKAMSVDELRNKLFNEEHNNLETVELALQLRNTLIENGENDPFLPYGEKIIPTDEDIAAANRVATVFQECVDYAQGDSDAFTNELMRRTVDTAPRRR